MQFIKESIRGAVATVLFGDVSSIVADIPAALVELRYSRDAKREADDYTPQC